MLRSHVVVDADRVVLGDIADVLTEEARDLEEALVCPGPLPGEQRIVSRSHVQRRLVQSGICLDGLRFTGAKEVVVEGACVRVAGDRIRSLVEEALRRRLDGEDVRMSFREAPEGVVLPPGTADLRVGLPDEGALQGHALVYVEAHVRMDAWYGESRCP